MPSFEDALAGGGISAGHVDAIAAATRNLNDQLLAEFVACETALLADAGNQRRPSQQRQPSRCWLLQMVSDTICNN